MTRFTGRFVLGILAILLVTSGGASAGARTFVSLAGRDDAIPKLGLPGIAVRIDAPDAEAAAPVKAELERELARQVHTRHLGVDEPGDYDLVVKMDEPRADGALRTIRFEAVLRSSRGEPLWRVDGRTEVEGGPVDGTVLAGVSRNVLSALIHDGWVQPRYDQENPPPPPPTIRNDQDGR